MAQTQITVIVDDLAGGRVPLAEHGLSMLIEKQGFRLLFDTGQGQAFRENARTLGMAFDSLDALALSHGHDDHTGNVAALLKAGFKGKVYFHPDVLRPRFSVRAGNSVTSIGFHQDGVALLEAPTVEKVVGRKLTRVGDGVMLTGEIERKTDFEDTGGRFYLDSECTVLDELLDDQSLILDVDDGIAIVAGCAHSGIVNVLRATRALYSEAPIRAVVGGIHLVNADPQRIAKTVNAFEEIAVERVILGHCTGFAGLRAFSEAFGDRFSLLCSGATLEI